MRLTDEFMDAYFRVLFCVVLIVMILGAVCVPNAEDKVVFGGMAVICLFMLIFGFNWKRR